MNRESNLKSHLSQILIILIVIAIILYGGSSCRSEEKQKISRGSDRLFTEMAVITGFGSSNISEGNYRPILLIGRFGIDLKKYFSALQNHSGRLFVFAEPQFNAVVKPNGGINTHFVIV
jgi:hypothetical protein